MNPDGTPVTHEQYLAMLEAQQHKCAICGTHVNGNGHLDHNHETGEPRGILCSQCNMALGWLEPHMDAAQAYRQLATKQEPVPMTYDEKGRLVPENPDEQDADTRTWRFQFHFPVSGKTPWESLGHAFTDQNGMQVHDGHLYGIDEHGDLYDLEPIEPFHASDY